MQICNVDSFKEIVKIKILSEGLVRVYFSVNIDYGFGHFIYIWYSANF